jgi:nucleotide-binding universal stress UspA family protein
MKSFQRVMVATDFTSASTAALREAVQMAQRSGGELIVVHAYTPPNVIQAEAVAPGVYQEWERNVRVAVETKLGALIDGARKAGVNARALAVSGTPDEAIAEAAKLNGADLLVLGTHGRKGVSRFFLGSVASRVISTAPCPVMTVRPERVSPSA